MRLREAVQYAFHRRRRYSVWRLSTALELAVAVTVGVAIIAFL